MKTTLAISRTGPYLAFLLLLLVSSADAYVTRMDQCEPIDIPRCRSMPYNMTQMPNLMHHSTQENARLVFQRFEILLDQHCSDVLLFLLCSIYVPICAVSLQPEAIPPCRSVCERARAGCEPLMNNYKVPWPDSLDCSRLPRYERGVCVSPEAFVKPAKATDKGCVCKARKPSFRVLKKYNYDYGIRAIVLKKKNISNSAEMVYKVKVTQILFSGKIQFSLNSDLILWVNSSCACPKLRKGKDHLIIGHEDGRGHKLLITQLSITSVWKDSWTTKVKRWHDQLQRRPADRRRRKPGRGQNKGQRQRSHKKVENKDTPFVSTSHPHILPVRESSNPHIQSVRESSNPHIQSVRESSNPYLDDILKGYTHSRGFHSQEFPPKYNIPTPL